MRALLLPLGGILLLLGIVLGFLFESRAGEVVFGAGLLMLGKAAFLYLTAPANQPQQKQLAPKTRSETETRDETR